MRKKKVEKKVGRVLHITNWHPNRENPFEAIWMQRHVQALAKYCENEVWHIQVRPQKKLKYHKYTDEYNCKHRVLDVPFRQWLLVEILTSFLFCWQLLFVIKKRNFDILNVHIAYPLLTFGKIIRFFTKLPVVITEHWSAYHLNFGMPKDTNKLGRIKRIFYRNIPLITVSKSLAADIIAFSGNDKIQYHVVPNVVQTEVFNCQQNQAPDNLCFFMVSGWAFPKEPNIVIEAFAAVLKKYPAATLDIGGYGKLLESMQHLVRDLKIEDSVRFLDRMSAAEIAAKLQETTAFLHCSGYETLSVVCAEAVCCGVPVIASKVGGIPEFINADNGVLVSENTKDSWADALTLFCSNYQHYQRKEIAQKAEAYFNAASIGEKYYKILNITANANNR